MGSVHESVFHQFAAIDSTWRAAFEATRKTLAIPGHVTALLRQGWNMQLSPREFFRNLSVSRMGTSCLLEAAELQNDDSASYGELVEQAIQFLGVRYSSVILGISLVNRIADHSEPPDPWKLVLSQMVSNIEIGYRLGSRVREVGIEGGALMGFAKYAGLAVYVSVNPKAFEKILAQRGGLTNAKLQQELFGFEVYQASAFVLQQLGFGHEIAYGAAINPGKIKTSHLELSREIRRWCAAFEWVEALREGRNYPGRTEHSSFFSEIDPNRVGPSGNNLHLDTLYAEVAKTRTHGSSWIWHLPLKRREKLAGGGEDQDEVVASR